MFIYWIHLPEHSDISVDGYVGISKNPSKRLKSHKSRSNNPHLSNCFKKYPNIMMDIILEANGSICKEIEEKLRPHKNIGWNIERGGGLPPVLYNHKHNHGREPWNKGKKTGAISEDTKLVRYANVRKPRSDHQKETVSKKLSGIEKPKLTCPHCNKIGGKPAMIRFHFEHCKSQ